MLGPCTTERLHFHFSLSGFRGGNGNPLQCFCLENPRDGGAWRAAVYGVTQSWTRLKRLSSSSRTGSWALSHGLRFGRHLVVWEHKWLLHRMGKPRPLSSITSKTSFGMRHWKNWVSPLLTWSLHECLCHIWWKMQITLLGLHHYN